MSAVACSRSHPSVWSRQVRDFTVIDANLYTLNLGYHSDKSTNPITNKNFPEINKQMVCDLGPSSALSPWCRYHILLFCLDVPYCYGQNWVLSCGFTRPHATRTDPERCCWGSPPRGLFLSVFRHTPGEFLQRSQLLTYNYSIYFLCGSLSTVRIPTSPCTGIILYLCTAATAISTHVPNCPHHPNQPPGCPQAR